jgi:hypothetical protein
VTTNVGRASSDTYGHTPQATAVHTALGELEGTEEEAVVTNLNAIP